VKPSVGRIVHFYPSGAGVSEPLMASITRVKYVLSESQVEEDFYELHLHVLYADGDGGFACSKPRFSSNPTEGCWIWPPRV
jgi:hypothetical protein